MNILQLRPLPYYSNGCILGVYINKRRRRY